MHTPGAHLTKTCARRRKCAHRAQGAPLISNTARYLYLDVFVIYFNILHKCKCRWIFDMRYFFFFFFFFFFRFLYRRGSAIMSWSSTHVLFGSLGHLMWGGLPNVHFSFVPLTGFEPMQGQPKQQVPTP